MRVQVVAAEVVGLDGRAAVFRRQARIGSHGIGQDHSEFLSANAGNNVCLAERPLEHFGHPPQDKIPNGVAVPVVDGLELVGVHDHYGEGGGGALP